MTETQAPWRGKTFRDLVQEAKGRIQEITAAELRSWQTQGADFQLLDVREPQDYDNGHIDGATSLPRGILELEIDDIAPNQDRPVVVYCGGGSRSALAADTLQVMGYSQVYSLAQVYRGWISA